MTVGFVPFLRMISFPANVIAFLGTRNANFFNAGCIAFLWTTSFAASWAVGSSFALPAHRNGTIPAANEDAAVEVALLAEEDAANEDPTAQLAAKEVVHKNAMQPALKKLAFRVPKNAITFAGKEIMRKNGTKPTVIHVARKNSTARTTENATAAPPQNPIDQKSGLKKVS
jgi:hypothetical protein